MLTSPGESLDPWLVMATLKSISRLTGSLIGNCIQHTSKCSFSNNYARICTTHRPLYKRTYPTLVLYPDGSSFTTRFHEPRQVIKLPMDISTLNEEEKAKWLAKRRPVKKMLYQDDVKSTFKAKQYVDLVKNKKKK